MKIIIIFGPPAVGKMTIGEHLARELNCKLIFNHQIIDLISEYFRFGTPSFNKLLLEFRIRLLEELLINKEKVVILTQTIHFNIEEDKDWVDKIISITNDFFFIELEASQKTRFYRNNTPNRLGKKKPSATEFKEIIKRYNNKYILNTDNNFWYQDHHLKINSDNLTATETARIAINHLKANGIIKA